MRLINTSHSPMARMQWWSLAGPKRAWPMAKPAPCSPNKLLAGIRTLLNSISGWVFVSDRCSKTGRLRRSLMPGASRGMSTSDCRLDLAASGSVTPTKIISLQLAWEALDENHLLPLITNSSPSRAMDVSKFTGSDEAACGSVMAKAEPMSPANRGLSHCSFCSAVAKSCSNSMLGTSGAWQLKTLDAHSRRPRISATPVNSKLDKRIPGSSCVNRGSAIFHKPSSLASSLSVCSISGTLCPWWACCNQSL